MVDKEEGTECDSQSVERTLGKWVVVGGRGRFHERTKHEGGVRV